jgi:hypothetical protein
MSNDTSTTIPSAKHTPKHLEIHQAIQDLSSITNQLDKLLTRIQGPTPTPPPPVAPPVPVHELMPDAVKPAQPEPTLSDILNGASGEIRTTIDHAHSFIGKLNEALF